MGVSTTLYNTCFVIQNENCNFWVDTGGRHGKERKRLYEKEAKEYNSGNVVVPDELEVIEL